MPMSPRLLRPRATGFSPRNIAGLYSWYDASQSSQVTLNGSTVSEWKDIVGGRHLSQGTAAAQPAYTTAGQNGRNCITYSGSGKVLRASVSSDWEFFHDGSSQWAMYVVASSDGTSGSGNIHTYVSSYSITASTYNLRGIALWHDFGGLSGNNNLRATISASGGLVARRDLSATGLGVVRAYELLGNPADGTSSNRLTLKNQAGTAGSNTNGTTTAEAGSSGGAFSVGAAASGTQYQLTGKFCELVIYKRPTALVTAETTAIINYLKTKWSL